MKLWITAVIIVLAVGGFIYIRHLPRFQTKPGSLATNQIDQTMTIPMVLTSAAFSDGGTIPAKYTCSAENVSPPLSWSGVPVGAKTLALTINDPDAPNGNWVHWLVWNIDPAVTSFSENTVPPSAIEGTTSFGKPGYGGPCPPSGRHHYLFTLYALDSKLDLTSFSDETKFLSAIEGHVLAKATLTGLYSK